MTEQLYYIQSTSGPYAYDYILWWGPNHNGYTYCLDRAGKYTEVEAKAICAVRGEEIAWKVEDVEGVAERAVEIGKLRKASTGLFQREVPKPPKLKRNRKEPTYEHDYE